MERWKLFAKGLIILALIRLIEWYPALFDGLGSNSKIVPLWQDYNNWFEPSSLWLTDSFVYVILGLYIVLLVWQFFKPNVVGLILVGVIQFQLHLVLYFFVTMADNWRMLCLWYAIAGLFFCQYKQEHWVKMTFVGHLMLFYWVSVWHKLSYPDWQGGYALARIAWHPYWGASFPDFFAGKIFTYAVMVLEIAFPITWLFKQTRKWGVFTGVLFHTILMLFIPVVGFSLIMIWSLLMILNKKEWQGIKKSATCAALFQRRVSFLSK